MGRAERITNAIKEHDYKLYCKANRDGKLCIYRHSNRVESYVLDSGAVLHSVQPDPYFVFAITHNWKESGYSVDWGIEPIMARLKALDLWNRDLVQEIVENEEKHEKAMDRQRRNTTEDFLYEFREDFKKTFSDVNVSNMSKNTKYKEL